MYTAISIITILVCIFLIIIVLVQNSKGGGLAQNFAGQQQILGVRKTADFLEKATWTCAAIVLVLSFVSVKIISSGETPVATGSSVDELIQNRQSNEQAVPSFDVQTNSDEQPLTLPEGE